MTDEQINKMIGMNQQLLMLLGMAMGTLSTVEAYLEREPYAKLQNMIDRIIYNSLE